MNASNLSAGTVPVARVSGSYTSITGVGTVTAGTWNANVIANAYTSANSSNGASTIVLRGASGEFAAGAITGTSISGNGSALTAINASAITTGTLGTSRTNATSANGASTLVIRDANGSFAGNVGTFTSVSGNGVALTAINASNISSGTVATARLASGTANASTYLRGDSTWAAVSGGTTIPAGTVMLFAQTAAPTGFTKNTTTGDNSALRVTTGVVGTGGSVAFTTAFASQTPTGSVSITAVSGSAGATTLSTPQIPSHSHSIATTEPSTSGGTVGAGSGTTIGNGGTNGEGGSGSHTHPFSFSSGSGTFSGNAINLAVQYIDVIRATKD
jgi:hypothetical protein